MKPYQPLDPRDDLVPVILGGDWSTYGIAREFYEAFGVGSICLGIGQAAIIDHSRILTVRMAKSMGDEDILAELVAIAADAAAAGKTVVLIANTDDRVETVERIRDRLPENVVCPLAPADVSAMVSDKVTFQELCQRHGLDVPGTEVVSLAGADPVAPSALAFPVIAKPAVSAEYVYLYPRGFKKVYVANDQAELDDLWQSLRAEGFSGSFLVQELIPGDDTYKDNIIIYCDRTGEPTLFAASTALLEDHAPSMLGNSVAMITRQMPDLWEPLAAMLKDIGWRGFASIDLKRDPRDGRKVFMDFNPRVGSNSYYVCAGGQNPMLAVVRDLVDGISAEPLVADQTAIYTRAPMSLVTRYLTDERLAAEVRQLMRAGRVANPLRFPRDTFMARVYGFIMEQNHVRKFRQYYPAPTESSF